MWRVRQRWLTPAAPVAGGCSLLSGNDALFPISCPKCCSLCRPPSVPAHTQTLISGLALCSRREFWGRERAGNSGFGWQDLCLALESSGKRQQAGFGGAAPGLGSLLVPFVVMVLPWGSRGTLLWRLETDPTAFAAENFPGHLAGAEPGDPTRSDTEENPNPAEHMDWVSVVLSGLSVGLQRSHGFVTMS